MSTLPGSGQLRRSAHHFPHLDPEVLDHLSVRTLHRRAWSGRYLRGDLIRAFGALHVDQPVAREKFLGLGEDAVSDRPSVLSSPDELRLGRAASPSVLTSSPDAVSFRAILPMNAMFASRISLGQLRYCV